MMEMETVSKALNTNYILTWQITREDFITLKFSKKYVIPHPSACCLLFAGFFLGFFHPEDGGDRFLQNVRLPLNYKA
jgi:hypothetical protein